MIIETNGSPLISGVKLRPGKHNYRSIDYKDPLTALQLKALQEIGAIAFDELVDAKPAEEALDDPEKTLEINYTKKREPKTLKVLEYEYKGSKIINPKAEEKVDAGKPDKPVTESGRDGDTDKRSGRVSRQKKD